MDKTNQSLTNGLSFRPKYWSRMDDGSWHPSDFVGMSAALFKVTSTDPIWSERMAEMHQIQAEGGRIIYSEPKADLAMEAALRNMPEAMIDLGLK
ncbi:hypothetical protein ACN8ZM_39905 (plasmid) [Burkholderia aenigmatica]|uniref:hypothetical protein n=1 Tax=Burkholderia aenigmatica TaxID=2015348 RepID=UPI003B4356DA